MTRRLGVVFLAALLAAAGAACQKKAEIRGLELQVGFAEKNLTDNLITSVQYKWKTTADFQKLDQDYSVFVHFWHGSNLLIQDDYMPEIPTSKWAANQEYVTTHRIYIPSFIDEFDPQFKGTETLRLTAGLYSPYDRTGKSKFEFLVKPLEVAPPPPDVPEIVYEEGWHDLEANPDAYYKQWRWTGREARCLIDNPRRDALLVIRGGVNKDKVPDQKVIFKINDQVLDEFVPKEVNFERSYSINRDMLGEKAEFYLTIATDKPFIPAEIEAGSEDRRELGILIAFIYFR